MFNIDIIVCYAYLGDKWAPPAPVWWLDAVRGMSLRKVSYEAFVFSRNQEKRSH